ncbi:MAG TPA: C40 family peptidase [Gemmatimonadales bacterium]|nr:C40 family peptidase [Gemmatimonadales bacterium]
MWRSALAPAFAGIMFLSVTPPLFGQHAAQQPWVFQAFAARKQPSGSPLFGGMSLAGFHRAWGLRVGGGVDLHTETSAVPAVACGPYGYGCRSFAQDHTNVVLDTWSVNVDLLFEPARVVPGLRPVLLGFSPYGFVGIGGYGVHLVDDPDTSIATWSYGVGAHHNVYGPLGLQAEARWLSPIETNNRFNGLRHNPEYRVGLAVSFGGPHHAKTPAPNAPPGAPDESAVRFASAVLDMAESYLNTPYLHGGAIPSTGFDAAGFVQYVFGQAGVSLPRTARDIAKMGENVPLRIGALRPGDLVFFAGNHKNPDHVAIYAGHDRIIHSTKSGGGVRYDVLGSGDRGGWFADHLVSARRIVPRAQPSGKKPADDKLDPPDLAPQPMGGPR